MGSLSQVPTDNSVGEQKPIISRLLDIVGDGSGSTVGVGDFSVTPRSLKITPPAGKIYRISRLVVKIKDNGSIDAAKYGNGQTLTTGIIVKETDLGGDKNALTGQQNILTNADWGLYCFDTDVKPWGTGDEYLFVRWTFSKSGQFIRLVGDNSESLEIVLNDDFSGLTEHSFTIQGYEEV